MASRSSTCRSAPSIAAARSGVAVTTPTSPWCGPADGGGEHGRGRLLGAVDRERGDGATGTGARRRDGHGVVGEGPAGDLGCDAELVDQTQRRPAAGGEREQVALDGAAIRITEHHEAAPARAGARRPPSPSSPSWRPRPRRGRTGRRAAGATPRRPSAEPTHTGSTSVSRPVLTWASCRRRRERSLRRARWTSPIVRRIVSRERPAPSWLRTSAARARAISCRANSSTASSRPHADSRSTPPMASRTSAPASATASSTAARSSALTDAPLGPGQAGQVAMRPRPAAGGARSPVPPVEVGGEVAGSLQVGVRGRRGPAPSPRRPPPSRPADAAMPTRPAARGRPTRDGGRARPRLGRGPPPPRPRRRSGSGGESRPAGRARRPAGRSSRTRSAAPPTPPAAWRSDRRRPPLHPPPSSTRSPRAGGIGGDGGRGRRLAGPGRPGDDRETGGATGPHDVELVARQHEHALDGLVVGRSPAIRRRSARGARSRCAPGPAPSGEPRSTAPRPAPRPARRRRRTRRRRRARHRHGAPRPGARRERRWWREARARRRRRGRTGAARRAVRGRRQGSRGRSTPPPAPHRDAAARRATGGRRTAATGRGWRRPPGPGRRARACCRG